ncbi:hypothetical protein H4R35_001862 [Dimargaris xerosporica]|nr:hypothetical protein H4R35_001862 [Dimargaris xerosporica]
MAQPTTVSKFSWAEDVDALSEVTAPPPSSGLDQAKGKQPLDSPDNTDTKETPPGAKASDVNADPHQEGTSGTTPEKPKAKKPSKVAAGPSGPCRPLTLQELVRSKVMFYAIDVEICPGPLVWSNDRTNLRQFAWAKFGTGCKKIFGKYYVMSDSLKKMGQTYEPTDPEFVSILKAQVDTQLRVLTEFQNDMQMRIKEGKRVVVIGPYIAGLRVHFEKLNIHWDPSVQFFDIGILYNRRLNRNLGSNIFLAEAMATMGLNLFSTRNAGK